MQVSVLLLLIANVIIFQHFCIELLLEQGFVQHSNIIDEALYNVEPLAIIKGGISIDHFCCSMAYSDDWIFCINL